MKKICSLEEYISIIKSLYEMEGCAGLRKIYYRGQSNCNYKLVPSLSHTLEGFTEEYENYVAFEKEIIERAKLEYPDNIDSCCKELVRDITKDAYSA